MSIRTKLAQVEKLAAKFSLSKIKSMSGAELEQMLLQGLEMEAQRASAPEHAAAIRAVGRYVLTPQGVADKNAPRLLVAALQNTLNEKDIPQ